MPIRFPLLLLALAATLPGTAFAAPANAGWCASGAPLATAAPEEFEDLIAQLELTPDDPELLDQVSRAASASERPDEALYYARLALRNLGPEPDNKSLAKALAARVVELDPRAEEVALALDTYADQVYRLGQAAMKKKLWANAVDLFLACEGSSYEKRANDQLKKIYSNANAGEALIASGIDVPVISKGRKSPDAIAALDRKHSSFDKPYEAKNKIYTIESDMGYVFTEAVLAAMTQANGYLRVMYQHKTRGQAMRRCVIRIYGTIEGFWEAYPQYDQRYSIGAFFSPNDNMIVTYDQTAAGRSFADVWSTLFHEGSHQFADDVSRLMMPTWIDEGVACYFEGTQLMPNGLVVDNLVPDSRLRSLVRMIGNPGKSGGNTSVPMKPGDASIDVNDFLTHIAPGSYDGRYYPWGWGFVYFMRNYEDENGERSYLPHFDAYVESYKGGGKHDVWERWLEYFIENPEKPGIETFDDFYAMWAAWIHNLNRIHFGGPDRADDLIERGKVQADREKHKFAAESFTWALRKRGNDPRAMYHLALANMELEEEDVAVYYLRKVIGWTYLQPDADAQVGDLEMTVAELREHCLERVGEIYSPLVEGAGEAEQAFEEAVATLADQYREAGLDRSAAQVYEEATGLLGRRRTLLEARDAIAAEAGFDLRQPRRMVVEPGLGRWKQSRKGGFKADGDGLAAAGKDGIVYVQYEEELPENFRFEATVQLDQKGGVGAFGVQLGAGFGSPKLIAYLTTGTLVTVSVDAETNQPEIEDTLVETMAVIPGGSFDLAIEVEGDMAEIFLDGESIGIQQYGAGELRGKVGFFAQGSKGEFKNMRLLY